MKKIENELKEIIKVMNGKLLLIGNYSNKLKEIIDNNENILFCDKLTSNVVDGKGKGKTKRLNIKKIKKHYKKNKINNTIVNFEEVKEYKNTFVKDSTYITKGNIIVIDKNSDETIFNMYKRYTKDIKIINCLDGKIFVINSSKAKNNKIKDMYYFIHDLIIDIFDTIGNLL